MKPALAGPIGAGESNSNPAACPRPVLPTHSGTIVSTRSETTLSATFALITQLKSTDIARAFGTCHPALIGRETMAVDAVGFRWIGGLKGRGTSG